MKLACADFSFPLLPHEHALDLIALLGVEGVDLAMMGNRSHVRPEQVREDLPRWTETLRERLRSRGLALADFFLIPWTDFETMAPNNPDPRQREDAAALFRDMLAMARELEAGGMTFLPGIQWPDESWEDSFARAVEELGWRLEEARAQGVRLSVEAHVGSIADTPEKALRLAEETGIELTLDYTHFVFQGFPEREIEPLVAHARHFHARGGAQGRLQTTLRESTIDYDRVLDVMEETGYDGYFGIEYVWTPGDPPGGPYDLTNTDNVSETILLRDKVRARG